MSKRAPLFAALDKYLEPYSLVWLHDYGERQVELVLAAIELIFFIVAGLGLCSGFVLKIVLITEEHFHD